MSNANGGKPYIDTTNFEADLEEAKQLLADAGYPDGEGFPTISYTTNDAGYHKVVAEYLQDVYKRQPKVGRASMASAHRARPLTP